MRTARASAAGSLAIRQGRRVEHEQSVVLGRRR